MQQYDGSGVENYQNMDGIVRYLAIENYYGLNDFGFKLYKKMQLLRVNEDRSERFKSLIDSFEEKGFDRNHPIDVNKHNLIKDGSHRLALAMYHRLDNVTIRINPKHPNRNYSINWFRVVGFNNNEICQIIEKFNDLMAFCQEKKKFDMH